MTSLKTAAKETKKERNLLFLNFIPGHVNALIVSAVRHLPVCFKKILMPEGCKSL